VTKDLTTAMAHCRKAADSGHSEAQFSLSLLALEDTPGAPELEQAIRYAESAENAGHAKAGYVRKKLEEKRTRSAPVASEKARSL
jgi:TPR repeat protein